MILDTVLPFLGDAVLIEDPACRVVRVNPAATRLTGWPEHEAVGLPVSEVLRFAELRRPTAPVLWRRKSDLLLTARDGTRHQVEHVSLPLCDPAGVQTGGLHVLKELGRPGRRMAALPGRAIQRDFGGWPVLDEESFLWRLQRLLARARLDEGCHTLLLVSIERQDAGRLFSSEPVLNDLGLRLAIGQMLCRQVRERDGVGWLGRDRFGLLLENCPQGAAVRIARKLCDGLETLQREGMAGSTIKLSAGIGLVPVDKRWGLMATLWNAAQESCRQACLGGRSEVHVWPDAERTDSARQRELNAAARIQQTLLVHPPPQDLGALQISGYSQASQGINGDFVEYIRVGPHALDVIVGDVMGKGMAAAMMGAATKLQFSRCMAELVAAHGGDEPHWPAPREVVDAVHRAMTPALQALEAFVTLCYLRIDTRSRQVTWVGCGHEEPLLVREDGRLEALGNQHPPLGILDQPDFIEESRPLGEGDGLFLYSDGVTDAVLQDQGHVGHDRLVQSVVHRMRLHRAPASILHAVRRDVLGAGVEVKDDVTMMVILQTGHAACLQAGIELEPSLRSLRKLREFLDRQLLASGLADQDRTLLSTACVEGFTNVVRHATGLLEGAPVELVSRSFADRVELELLYLGDPFVPPDLSVGAAAELRPESGLGMEMMRQTTDWLDYAHVEGVNRVRMARYRTGALRPDGAVAPVSAVS